MSLSSWLLGKSSKRAAERIAYLIQFLLTWWEEEKTLFAVIPLAIALHIILIGVIWLGVRMLTYPKPPVVTTVVEYDLEKWLKTGKPDQIFDEISNSRGEH